MLSAYWEYMIMSTSMNIDEIIRDTTKKAVDLLRKHFKFVLGIKVDASSRDANR